MSWDPITTPIWYAKVTGKRTPGITEITGNSGSPRKWDEVTGYGFSGSTLRFTGLGLAKFDMLIELYTKADWADWTAFLPIILKVPSRRVPRSLDVWHPWLEMYQVKSAVVLDFAFPKLTEEGKGQVLISWQAQRKVKFQLAKVEDSAATPLDPFEQKIEASAKRLEALAAQ